jgi:hypothetical protein
MYVKKTWHILWSRAHMSSEADSSLTNTKLKWDSPTQVIISIPNAQRSRNLINNLRNISQLSIRKLAYWALHFLRNLHFQSVPHWLKIVRVDDVEGARYSMTMCGVRNRYILVLNFQKASFKLYKICYEQSNVIESELTRFHDNPMKIICLQAGGMYLIQNTLF